MKKIRLILLTIFLCLACSIPAQAALIGLFDYGVNIDGTVSVPTLGDPVPAVVDISAFDDITGLGTLTVTVTGLGDHNVDLFVDHEIDEDFNTFFNERGATSGAQAANQTWEIDEPGFEFGDIFVNFNVSSLDNKNAVPAGAENDVSMALGWDFSLAASESAVIDFLISTTAPGEGFYLIQTDPDPYSIDPTNIYFSSGLRITGGGDPPIPEPATLLLLGTGLIGLCAVQRKKLFKK